MENGLKLWGWLDPDHADPIAGKPAVDAWLARTLDLQELTPTPPVEFDAGKKRRSRLTPAMRRTLAGMFGDSFSDDVGVRARHSLGQSYADQLERRAGRIRTIADAVVFPRSADEVAALLKAAGRSGFRVTPSGGSTGVVGGFRPGDDKRPWVVADMAQMNQIFEISQTDRTVTAEAGIFLSALDETLSHSNLTLGHYPQSFEGATLGGTLATNGSGQRSDRYGRLADNLVSARVATPTGVWSTEQFRHAAAGPWAGGLVAGSEGMFGILTDATLRLHEAPEHVEDRAWLMPSFEAACEAVRELAQAGHRLAMLRIWDEAETAFVTGFRLARSGLDQPSHMERMLLLLKRAPRRGALVIAGYEGTKRATGAAFRPAAQAFRRHKGTALGARAGASWRKGRYEAPYLRESLMARGLGVDTFETAASWSRLGALHDAVTSAVTEAAARTLGRQGRPAAFAHVSHSYVEGASLYVTAIFPRSDKPLEQWREIKRAATEAIIAHGGTVSHQHGLGADHAEWAAAEKGEIGLRLIEAVRRELDPKEVMAVGAAKGFSRRELRD